MIPLLLFFRSKASVLIGLAILLIASHAFVYSSGRSVGREELALYKLTVKAVGEAQEAKTRQVIISQQQIANEANDEATKLRAALTAYFDDPRVQVNYDSSKRKLPAVSDSAKRVDASAAKRETDPSGVDAEGCVAVRASAEDAMTVLLWQKWATENMVLRP